MKGVVSGTINNVEDFSSVYGEDEKEGHFYPVKFLKKYYDTPIELSGRKNGNKTITPTEQDPYLIIRLENLEGDTAIAKVSGKDETVFELDFSGATKA